ncbi:putative WRKY transcription factor 75 [Iris pallida]|uniref:WRKY transcription factor 75 n=1 Tax=Iris pallida TaxID=29817 RepID=A0AAX6E4E2_IRIPA|nr:putative WRKY transcription factor 75 [Iris pallida]
MEATTIYLKTRQTAKTLAEMAPASSSSTKSRPQDDVNHVSMILRGVSKDARQLRSLVTVQMIRDYVDDVGDLAVKGKIVELSKTIIEGTEAGLSLLRPPQLSNKNRRAQPKRVLKMINTWADAYEWRKYGSKRIQNQFTREYFYCKGCGAKKQVQILKVDEDGSPVEYLVSYMDDHTCQAPTGTMVTTFALGESSWTTPTRGKGPSILSFQASASTAPSDATQWLEEEDVNFAPVVSNPVPAELTGMWSVTLYRRNQRLISFLQLVQ